MDICQGYIHGYHCWIYTWICFQDKLDGYERISINNLRISFSDIGLGYVVWIYSGISEFDILKNIIQGQRLGNRLIGMDINGYNCWIKLWVSYWDIFQDIVGYRRISRKDIVLWIQSDIMSYIENQVKKRLNNQVKKVQAYYKAVPDGENGTCFVRLVHVKQRKSLITVCTQMYLHNPPLSAPYTMIHYDLPFYILVHTNCDSWSKVCTNTSMYQLVPTLKKLRHCTCA